MNIRGTQVCFFICTTILQTYLFVHLSCVLWAIQCVQVGCVFGVTVDHCTQIYKLHYFMYGSSLNSIYNKTFTYYSVNIMISVRALLNFINVATDVLVYMNRRTCRVYLNMWMTDFQFFSAVQETGTNRLFHSIYMLLKEMHRYTGTMWRSNPATCSVLCICHSDKTDISF